MELKSIDQQLSVSAQILPSDIVELAQLGYGLVINNRPDGEAADQPSSQQIESACKEQGLDYVYLPLVPNQVTPQLVAQYAESLAGADTKVLAFCRTGNRSCTLWALGKAGQLDTDQIINKGVELGYPLEGLRPMLDGAV
ncbi:TIGR01244 family phosphatase [Alginatibacterium sediminis]|uniref:TIGR01244 family phosphatase n=1 Tax=Alginatibacterium sediminis TaxID=2164068 RepID=A0A420E8M5_9ALTE|nr:TIGR01244 family sulfur transferase [Alginatibacterium sediminis]RKF15678.1 TIGR01244 family phosphatase [Alginatibacterium sediminis]